MILICNQVLELLVTVRRGARIQNEILPDKYKDTKVSVWDRAPLIECWFTKESPEESVTFFWRLQQIQEYKDRTERCLRTLWWQSVWRELCWSPHFPSVKGACWVLPFASNIEKGVSVVILRELEICVLSCHQETQDCWFIPYQERQIRAL